MKDSKRLRFLAAAVTFGLGSAAFAVEDLSSGDIAEIEALLVDRPPHAYSRNGVYERRQEMGYDRLSLPDGLHVWHRVGYKFLLDVDEIKNRQGAIREILTSLDNGTSLSSQLSDILKAISAGLANASYHEGLEFSDFPPLHIFNARPLRQDSNDPKVQKYLNTAGEVFQATIRLLMRLEAALRGVGDRRLRQIHWILESLVADHPYDVSDLAQRAAPDKSAARDAFVAAVAGKADVFKRMRHLFLELDFYVKMAQLSHEMGWHTFAEPRRAEEMGGVAVRFQGLYPPGMKATPENPRRQNDVALDRDGRTMTLTGGNNSGKTTLMRSVALNLVLGMAGSAGSIDGPSEFVPGEIIFLQEHNVPDAADYYGKMLAQAKTLRELADKIRQQPQTYVFLDEVLSGTMPEIRSVLETVFLRDILAPLGSANIVTTHNLTTATLDADGQITTYYRTAQVDGTTRQAHGIFRNFHMNAEHKLQSGPQLDLKTMMVDAVAALRAAGWPPDAIALAQREFDNLYTGCGKIVQAIF